MKAAINDSVAIQRALQARDRASVCWDAVNTGGSQRDLRAQLAQRQERQRCIEHLRANRNVGTPIRRPIPVRPAASAMHVRAAFARD